MAIQVTCPSCLKRFTVSDKYAGRTGPCPTCQKPIKIPEKADEVVIHAPVGDSPKDSAGRSILRPIRRKDVNLGLPVIVGGVLTTVVVFSIAFGLGLSGKEPHTMLLAISSILLAAPLVFIGYWFLHDDELEGFNGRQLSIRSGIVAVAFAALWALYAYLPRYVSGYASMSEFTGMDMFIAITVMLIAGTLVAIAALELEATQGVMLYMLYFSITFILAWLAGTRLGAPLSPDGDLGSSIPPPATAPAEPGPPAQPDQNTQQLEPGKEIPKLLQ